MCKDLDELITLCGKVKYDKVNAKSEITKILKKGIKLYPNDFRKLIDKKPSGLEKHDLVFIAGLVELLCISYDVDAPEWINSRECYLDKPFVSYKGYVDRVPEQLILVTNNVFAKRNYYTNENLRLV